MKLPDALKRWSTLSNPPTHHLWLRIQERSVPAVDATQGGGNASMPAALFSYHLFYPVCLPARHLFGCAFKNAARTCANEVINTV